MSTEDTLVNILMVDDRPENLLALEAIIEREDYRLIKAASGEEALKYLLKYDFAVILLDIQMPGIDGFGTAKIIKAREKTKNIPIIFITANHLDSTHIFTGYSLGAIDYLLKPFDPVILKTKVEGFVELFRLNQKLKQHADILSEQKKEIERAYSELRASEALANVISDTSIDSMLITDQEGVILQTNPAVRTMFGYPEAELVGRRIEALFSGDVSQELVRSVFASIRDNEDAPSLGHVKEVTGRREDGTTFPAETQFGSRFVQGKVIVACTIRDITKKKKDQETITFMAYHDVLTRLPNRRLFNDRLSEALQSARMNNRSVSILFLDMDRFKYVNDSLGHLVGDRLLCDIANRLSVCVGEGDLVSRFVGDEFNVILPDTDREAALECAERILKEFKRPFYIDSFELFITASIGISVFPYDGEEPQLLMKNADAALYRAKEQGKNRYKVFHSGMNLGSYRTFILQNDLRKAIERNELAVVYQPRIDVGSEAVKSAEALVRWKHSNWGMIYPSEFIPLAEETGQIGMIGEWVLRMACRQSKTWLTEDGFSIRVAVNFSVQQLLQRDIGDRVLRILEEEALPPALLEIEITESALMGNEDVIARTLMRLKEAGVSVSIDDFGTGYSSFNLLRRFAVDTLKIDKSFIQDMSKGASDGASLVKTMISLAHSLRMTVVAEGVETEEQLELLKGQQCDAVQGFYFCHPVAPPEFEAFLRKCRPSRIAAGANAAESQTMTVMEGGGQSDWTEPHERRDQKVLEAALLQTKQEYSISPREFDVFHLMVNGFSNKEISEKLFISEHTVKNHITHIFQKLKVTDRIQAMSKIYQSCIREGGLERVKSS